MDPAAPAPVASRPLLGILFMCGAGTLFPVMNGLVKMLSGGYASEQIIWARNTSHLLFVLALFMPRRGLAIFRTSRPAAQFGRSLALLGSTVLYFVALRHLPLAKATAINFMSPFLVVLLAWPLLGERIVARRLAAVIAGFVGVLVVIRPGTAVFQWSSLLILGSGTCFALYQILTRGVAAKDAPETSVVYSVLIGAAAMTLVVPFSWKTPVSLVDAVLMAGLGVLGGLGHYCVARALVHAQASLVSPFMYFQMIGSVAFGYLAFGEMPDALVWLGTAIIVGAGLSILWHEGRSLRAPDATTRRGGSS